MDDLWDFWGRPDLKQASWLGNVQNIGQLAVRKFRFKQGEFANSQFSTVFLQEHFF